MCNTPTFKVFIKDALRKRLLKDIRNLYIFNEGDLQAAAWFYIREYFRKRSDHSAYNYYVRCNPTLGNKEKPDIVVLKKLKPVYFIEFKFIKSSKNEISMDRSKIIKDLEKLQQYSKKYEGFKGGFLVCVYDADEATVETDMNKYDKISLIPINIRKSIRGRLWKGYKQWRAMFDKLREAT